MKLGIIGAGYVGRTIAKLAIEAGHQVMISNSRGPETLFSLRAMTGCETGTVSEAIKFGEFVVVAVPLNAVGRLPADQLVGKQLLDAVNYYPERDGQVAALEAGQISTSQWLAEQLPGAIITKAFNAIPMTELETDGLPEGTEGRRALPLAGDNVEGKRIAAELYQTFGFDTVDAGGLAEGRRFERGTPAYCVRMTRDELETALSQV